MAAPKPASPGAGSQRAASPLKVRRGRARKFVCQIAAGLGTLCWLASGITAWLAGQPERISGLQTSLPGSEVTDPGSRFWLLCGLLFVLGLCNFSLLLLVLGPRREWERIMDLSLAQRGTFNRLLLGSLGVVLTQLSLPLLLGYLLDEVVNVRRDLLLFFLVLGLILLMLVLRGLSAWLRSISGQSLAYRVAADLRLRLFGHLQSLSFAYFDRARQGELISRLTNDVQALQNFILNGTEDFFVAPFMVIGGLACVVFLNWQLAIIIFVSAGLLGVFMQFTFRRLREVNQAAQRELGALTSQVSEGLNTIRLAQSFGIEEDQLGRFARTNGAALGRLLETSRLSARLSPFNEALGFTAPLVIIASMGYLAIRGGSLMQVGEVTAIAGIAALVANPLGKLSRLMTTLSSGEAASARIHELLDTKAEISDHPNAVSIESCDGRLEFDNVSLSYGPASAPALSNIDLKIEPGEAMAFVGESGSGKSSLVHLVPRFYEASAGRVLLDGRDVRDISLASLRRQCAIVSQDTILIHGTIRENIAYGSPGADEKDIVDAAMSANAHNFIIELEGGYDAMVGEKGVTLSGGQRQRIAIARALLRDPRILLLDEATSALDSHAEALVQDALNKLMYGRTTLVVAHRLSTIRNASRIVVMKAGRIVEQGTHDELLKNANGEYSRLVKLQGLG